MDNAKFLFQVNALSTVVSKGLHVVKRVLLVNKTVLLLKMQSIANRTRIF